MKKWVLLFGCACLLNGCGTIVSRTPTIEGLAAMGGPLPRYYPATHLDADLITGPSNPQHGSIGARTVFCVCGVVDAPISVVMDTLLLPYDSTKKGPYYDNAISTKATSQPQGGGNGSH